MQYDKTINIYGHDLPVVGVVEVKGADGATADHIPVIDTMSDSRWIELGIESRLQHPENYPNEDIPAVIAQQRQLLEQIRLKESQPQEPTINVQYGHKLIPIV